MFLKLNHQKLDVYSTARELVIACYRLSDILPAEERYGLKSQIRRAAVSVCLNIAEGASRRSADERKRFYEIARGSLIEVDAALDVANSLGYLVNYDLKTIEHSIVSTFKLLCGMINPGPKS